MSELFFLYKTASVIIVKNTFNLHLDGTLLFSVLLLAKNKRVEHLGGPTTTLLPCVFPVFDRYYVLEDYKGYYSQKLDITHH